MGLSIVVGILADLKQNDIEGYEYHKQQFEKINAVFRKNSLPEHIEPETLDSIWYCDMWGYSGLHYLRRIAAYLSEGKELPEPGNQDVPDDQILKKYYRSGNLAQVPDGFDFSHLMFHADNEGYYFPQPFQNIQLADKEIDGLIGSSYTLMNECEKLAAVLELPLEMDIDADELHDAIESQGEGEAKWEQYGVESFTCLRLYHACKRSIETGAAVCFC